MTTLLQRLEGELPEDYIPELPEGLVKLRQACIVWKLELKDMPNSRRKLGEVYFIRAGTLSVNQGDTERKDKYNIMIARLRRRLKEKRKTEKVD